VITVDEANPTPPYEQVREQIAAQIRTGKLTPGQRLPSVRQLAADLHLAAGTVARAYRLLEEAALVETSRSTGTRVRAGNGIDPRITVAALNLIESLAPEPVDLQDVLAAITINWRQQSPS
jgi:DNA-binding transcriptional regulator YhcF (GntR family)